MALLRTFPLLPASHNGCHTVRSPAMTSLPPHTFPPHYTTKQGRKIVQWCMTVQRSEREERKNHSEECEFKKILKKETNPGNLQVNYKNTPKLPGIQSWMLSYSQQWPAFSHHLSLSDQTLGVVLTAAASFAAVTSLDAGFNTGVGRKVVWSLSYLSWVLSCNSIQVTHSEYRGSGALQMFPGVVCSTFDYLWQQMLLIWFKKD